MSIQIGKTALDASQIALDTIGKNITHANDPTYARQRVHVTSTHHGSILNRIEAAVSYSLEKDVIRENANLGYYTSQSQILNQIESSINELTDQDISSALDQFYNDLEKLSLDPHDIPLRHTVLESAEKVSDIFKLVSNNFETIEDSMDQEIGDSAEILNNLLSRIATQNLEVVRREGGVDDQPANELRTTRRELINELSELINITTTELSNGSVMIQSDGRTLVFQGEMRGVYSDTSDGINRLRYTGDNSFVAPKGGTLGGLIEARDSIVNAMSEELDTIAREFMWQVNKVHNTGRGLTGKTKMVADTKIHPNFIDLDMSIATVDEFTLANTFKPENGTLTVKMRNEITGEETEETIDITMLGENNMTLLDLRDELDSIENLSASIDNIGRLTIESSSGHSFFFSEDTSNVTSFLGLNNFFDGSEASNIQVNSDIEADPTLLAVAKSASPGDNSNLVDMIATRTAKLSNGFTLNQTYETYVSKVATQTSRINSLKENQERIVADVNERRQTYSGVNLDEEAALLLKFQQMYGAAAQYISIQNQLFQFLMNTL